jgi:glycosyltransferase involved in cell wall biosynthesis
MRLLVFNLATDADDPILGFATGWLTALAKRVELIRVITMRAGRVMVPRNVVVYSVGKEKGYSEPRRAIEFYRHLGRVVRTDRVDVCFSHMIPIFTVMAAPVLRAKGIPIVTWHAHPSRTLTLKAAHHVSDRIVTSIPTAYPYRRDKLTVVGQGIDTGLFIPDGLPPESPPIVLCVGRLSPVKDHATLLRAAHRLRSKTNQPFRVVILGGPGRTEDENYVNQLRRLVDDLAIRDLIEFHQPETMARIPEWYRRCTVHVNLTPSGFADKVAWEAMACGRPSVAANEGFRDTFGKSAELLLFRYGDPDDLANRLEALLTAPQVEMARIGLELRDRVVERHSLDRLAEKLLGVVAQHIRAEDNVPTSHAPSLE